MHTVQAVLDHFRVGRVNAKKLFSEEDKPVSHDKSNGTYENQTDRKDLFHALTVSGSHVLASKTQVCLVYRVHGCVYKALQISSGCVSGHGDGSERVHRGLDQYVGDGENSSLQSCRKTDPGNVQQFILVDGQLVKFQAAHAVQSHQAF